MESSTKKKGIKNTTFGLLSELITIGFGLILPRLFITSYGSEMNGLLSSISQLYVYVALLEAGIGTASLTALYKTVAHEDRNATNGVLAATHYFYKRTGVFYLLAVIALSIGYPLFVQTDIPFFTVFSIILLNGLSGVVSYFFQGKYRILIKAEGKVYVLTNLGIVINIITNFAKIIMISLGFDIILIHVVYFLINLLQMSFIMFYIKKNYPWIDLSVEPNKKAIESKNSVIVHQISDLVFSNTDVLTLTLFTGLKSVSVYTIYAGLFNMVKSILFALLEGVKFALGQMYNKDFERFKSLEHRFEACYMVLTFAFYSILYVLILPFIKIYTRGIADINYVDRYIPMLFAVLFLLQGARGPMQLVTNYAQHFKQTQHQAIIEAVINIVVSILAVLKFGIYGVLIGTIVALLYRANAIIIYVNRKILKQSPFGTYKRWIWCAVVFAGVFVANEFISVECQSYIKLVIFAIPVAIIVFVLYAIGMFVFERDSFVFLLDLIKNGFKLDKLKKK